MKEQYIKQVKKQLNLPRKTKCDVLRDLDEIFASGLEHGETEQDIMKRLGSPEEFTAAMEKQLGVTRKRFSKKEIFSTAAALAIAAAAFIVYGIIRAQQLPEGVIGYADAMTGIQVEGSFANLLWILLLVGLLATGLAIFQLIRILYRKKKRNAP